VTPKGQKTGGVTELRGNKEFCQPQERKNAKNKINIKTIEKFCSHVQLDAPLSCSLPDKRVKIIIIIMKVIIYVNCLKVWHLVMAA